MGSIWGNRLKISIFGESHGKGIGMVLDGLPPGHKVDWDQLSRYAARRAPGRTPWSTPRKEKDEPEILSGIYKDRTTGAPLTILIRNTDTRSADYDALQIKPRPGHADLTGAARYLGYQDPRGSGHFSGRLTAPLVFAGALCSQILAKKHIYTASHLLEVAGIRDESFNAVEPDEALYQAIRQKDFPVLDDDAGRRMVLAVLQAAEQKDSVGGIVETMIWGLPAGMGDPMFAGLESKLSGLIFGIPAVKGVEFGSGFECVRMRGSKHNDVPYITEQGIRFKSNYSGGIQGGISNGMPIVFRAAIKPTSSIGREQETINLKSGQNDTLMVEGRHDPCIAPRALPVIEAAAALFCLDLLLETKEPLFADD